MYTVDVADGDELAQCQDHEVVGARIPVEQRQNQNSSLKHAQCVHLLCLEHSETYAFKIHRFENVLDVINYCSDLAFYKA